MNLAILMYIYPFSFALQSTKFTFHSRNLNKTVCHAVSCKHMSCRQRCPTFRVELIPHNNFSSIEFSNTDQPAI